MKTIVTLLLALVSLSSAFVVNNNVSRRVSTGISMAIDQAPPTTTYLSSPSLARSSDVTSPMNMGVHKYLDSSSSNMLSLKEVKKPTAEEVAAKKRNFNIIFWGGGFVAPFLATVFYFGPKFWTK
uniref:Uncharacterized protein n=1 Tax=Eucampia antarctica TaxID=49252 RepID=A0A6U0QN48_9STRA|mmetsp:Transcript_17027/g.16451  ORF Transcript_17027/g.16451 Transcript_17027/m.16451 type:complete len:125 (+) Transcript_17027:226-600(+)|eukprot:CAMPEP_0197830186 /NCGR_PEP_ID=MMETSP1437-20131217/6786_1 /TAXON_ID=49252 ORGANISM="Eucampia antarctica, Strain CCMP1452" /NCGR_SAMPLE_ID=MMETSP1437 /ASSEMBLY_ACC=CAM_ASM_001096 /LENGTH=124 /DNA_ID=CAMNT_0043432399 /DNA_START=189 /DNA_END=563 /DNA_ORIENTATION=+